MVRVIIHLSLDQYQEWRPVFDRLASARQAMGSEGGELLRSSENSNVIFIIWKWNNLQRAKEYFELPAWQSLMKSYGTTKIPEINYFDLAENIVV